MSKNVTGKSWEGAMHFLKSNRVSEDRAFDLLDKAMNGKGTAKTPEGNAEATYDSDTGLFSVRVL